MSLDEKYATGVVWQDFQHKELLNLFGKLKKARENKADKDAFKFAIAFLSMYVNQHFKLEEEYMRVYDYPDRDAHQKKHKDFIQTLKKFRQEHKTYSESGMEDLLAKLNQWILDHIFKTDKQLGAHILESEKRA